MTKEYFSDKAKVELLVEISEKRGWLDPRKVNLWIKENRVEFSPAGSAIPSFVYATYSEEYIANFIDASDPTSLCVMILNSLVGIVVFPNVATEFLFWEKIKYRLEFEYEFKVPEEIIPLYIKNYKKDS